MTATSLLDHENSSITLEELQELERTQGRTDDPPMTSQDKFEAAWTLVKEGDKFSKRQIREMTTISERTIATMRAVLKEDPGAAQVDWRSAKRLQFDQSKDFNHDDWVEKAAIKMAKQLVQNVGPNLTQRPEVTALALRKISPDLPRALVQEWPEEVEEYAKELAQMKELDI